jgi:hypothetical protein
MPRDLPVALAFDPAAGRQDAWGRLESLSALGARLLTLSRVEKRERLLLSFELNGERFDALDASVSHVEQDPDGYSVIEADFVSPLVRRRLSAALLDALSR